MVETLTPDARIPTDIHWTRDQCKELEEAGVLDYRYELIEGEIIRMSQNMPHAGVLNSWLYWISTIFSHKHVLTQASIDVAPEDNPTNEPMPDIIALAKPYDQFEERAKPHEILLLIEIADSSIRLDKQKKLSLYARAGIVEYWVVDIQSRQVTVYRDPADGNYRSISELNDEEFITASASPASRTLISDLLPSVVIK